MNDDEELATLVKWIIVVFAAFIVCGFMYWQVYPMWENSRTRAIQNSQGYIESHNQHARDMIVVYNAAVNSGQRKATLNDICATANELQRDQVDRDVRHFVENNC